MATIEFVWQDKIALLKVIAAASALAGPKKIAGLRRAINHTGDKVYTAVRREISRVTSVPPRSIDQYGAMKKRRATDATLTYEIRSSGKGIPYKAMGARQTRAGVTVLAWGKRFLIPHAFIGQGSLNGHVFIRRGSSRLPIKALTGPSIPKELVKPYVAREFSRLVSSDLPTRVEHEVRLITNGVLS